MIIQSSILAGEIILILENASTSVRINDFEKLLQASKEDITFAIMRLLSEGLIELIKEDEQASIILTKSTRMHKNKYLKNKYVKNNVAELLVSADQT